MNKLAFFGVIILGLVLLVTHLVVTLIIGVGPRFVISCYDMRRDMAAFTEETAIEIKKSIEEGLARYQEEVKERRLQGDTAKETPLCWEYSLDQNEVFDQNYVEDLVKSLNEKSKPVRTECEWIFSKRTKGTIKFPTWLTIYGLIGSLLIICGTAFVAIALLRVLRRDPSLRSR